MAGEEIRSQRCRLWLSLRLGLLHIQSASLFPGGVGSRVGCLYRGIVRAPHGHFLFFAVQAPVRCSPQIPRNLAFCCTALLGSSWLPACQEAALAPCFEQCGPGAGVGVWGADPVKFSKPQVPDGIWPQGLGRVCLGWTKLPHESCPMVPQTRLPC